MYSDRGGDSPPPNNMSESEADYDHADDDEYTDDMVAILPT